MERKPANLCSIKRNSPKVDDETIVSTPQPFASSTELRKSQNQRRRERDFFEPDDRDYSLGVLSIDSDDVGSFIDDIQLKDSRKDIRSYLSEQRELANRALQRRESKISRLPSGRSRLLDLSSASQVPWPNSSTISECDLVTSSSTSTPKVSIQKSANTIDMAGTLTRLSLECKNPNLSLDEAYRKVLDHINQSLSIKSDMFKSSEEAQQQLQADEVSWRKKKELIPENIDFTPNDSHNSDISSISAYFRQRTEDLSNIIPSKTDKATKDIPDNQGTSSATTLPSSISASDISVPPSIDFERVPSECELNQTFKGDPKESDVSKESLSVTRIAELLENIEGTPSKVLSYLMKQCPGEKVENPVVEVRNNTLKSLLGSISEQTDQDSGNYDPSTLTPNKENFDCSNKPQQSSLSKVSGVSKSLTSLGSTSSLSNLPNGKLPIETTHCELVWGCVKSGNCETRQFTIRNKSSSKLHIQCSISGPLFRILQDRIEDTSNSIKILLRGNETKSISVIFNPLHEGAAADEIVFSPCNSNLQQSKKQSIKLYGYGGSCSVEFKNRMLKDSAGRYWLSLGNLLGQQILSERITVVNRGSLPAFAFFDYNSKDFVFSKLSVNPSATILKPFEEQIVEINLELTKEDVKYLHNHMSTPALEIGSLKIISGTEATRGRIKRLSKIIVDKELEIDNLAIKLMQDFQGEAIPTDVVKCRESITSLKPLLLGLSQKEIVLIVEKDLDATVVPAMNDDTSTFQSLYHDSTFTEESVKIKCKLEPSLIIFNPPIKTKDILFLTSESDKPLTFEVKVCEGIVINKKTGTLKPKSTIAIQVEINNNLVGVPISSKVTVNVEGDILSSDLKVKYF